MEKISDLSAPFYIVRLKEAPRPPILATTGVNSVRKTHLAVARENSDGMTHLVAFNGPEAGSTIYRTDNTALNNGGDEIVDIVKGALIDLEA